jgi:prepilin-type N-terminal cleavage/methylation domain-containing protein
VSKQGNAYKLSEDWTMESLKMKRNPQKGFTLVEIAIVLVIIGLLLGGVLKGQELIENSKVKSVTKDFDNISAAYWAYRDRTGEYPAAADFWSDLAGEGFITGTFASGATSGPEHALDGVFTYSEAADGGFAAGVKHICASGIENRIAQNIDTKIDDGDKETGSVRSSGEYGTDGTKITLCKELQ